MKHFKTVIISGAMLIGTSAVAHLNHPGWSGHGGHIHPNHADGVPDRTGSSCGTTLAERQSNACAPRSSDHPYEPCRNPRVGHPTNVTAVYSSSLENVNVRWRTPNLSQVSVNGCDWWPTEQLWDGAVDGYMVYRKECDGTEEDCTSSANFRQLEDCSSNCATHFQDDLRLNPGRHYAYAVHAQQNGYLSDFASDAVPHVLISGTDTTVTLIPPANLETQIKSKRGGIFVKLTWDDVFVATMYQIEWKRSQDEWDSSAGRGLNWGAGGWSEFDVSDWGGSTQFLTVDKEGARPCCEAGGGTAKTVCDDSDETVMCIGTDDDGKMLCHGTNHENPGEGDAGAKNNPKFCSQSSYPRPRLLVGRGRSLENALVTDGTYLDDTRGYDRDPKRIKTDGGKTGLYANELYHFRVRACMDNGDDNGNGVDGDTCSPWSQTSASTPSRL